MGNLSLGGNGKTPMVEYLIRMFGADHKIAVLSRGYGRASSGFRLANPDHTAEDIGDEPLQVYRKFPGIEVAVGESRALAIPKILLEKPEVELIILDDAFQHREVVPQFSILVTDYGHPFFKDYVLPAGRLREPRSGIRRADAVVVTKCPVEISAEQRMACITEIHRYHKLPVYFTTIEYKQPVHFATGVEFTGEATVLLVTGIAKAGTLVDHVGSHYSIARHMKFSDHFRYGKGHVSEIIKQFKGIPGNSKIILTTEKDMVRLLKFQKELESFPLYYLPIECKFIEEDGFKSMILNSFAGVNDQ